jgi:hypothetical protein
MITLSSPPMTARFTASGLGWSTDLVAGCSPGANVMEDEIRTASSLATSSYPITCNGQHVKLGCQCEPGNGKVE